MMLGELGEPPDSTTAATAPMLDVEMGVGGHRRDQHGIAVIRQDNMQAAAGTTSVPEMKVDKGKGRVHRQSPVPSQQAVSDY
jgi:hypothetical protein